MKTAAALPIVYLQIQYAAPTDRANRTNNAAAATAAFHMTHNAAETEITARPEIIATFSLTETIEQYAAPTHNARHMLRMASLPQLRAALPHERTRRPVRSTTTGPSHGTTTTITGPTLPSLKHPSSRQAAHLPSPY